MPRNTDYIPPIQAAQAPAYADAAGFVTPDWVNNARQTIGTGVEPVYPKKLGGHGGDTLMDDTTKAPIGYRYDNGQSQYVYLDMAGKPTGQVESRGNGIFGQITDMAKTVAPLALTALGANFLAPALADLFGGAAAADAGGGGLLDAITGGGGAGTSLNEMVASGLTPGSVGAAGAAAGALTPEALAAAAGTAGTGSALANLVTTGTGAVTNTAPSINEMVASGLTPGSVGATGATTGALTGDALTAAAGTGLTGTGLISSITNGLTSLGTNSLTSLGTSAITSLGTSALTSLGTSALSALTTGSIGSLLTGLLPSIAGIAQGNSAADAAKIQADAITKAAQIAADAAKFKPVGVTTAFGTSNFGYDANGNLTSAGYNLTPELAAQRDAMLKTAGSTGMDWMKNTQEAGQGLFNLGQSYIAKTPEQAAADWMAAQQKVLQPAQDTAYARMQQNLANTGRGGLSIAQGTGMGAANPEAQAYYNALAQQNNQLAAQAQAEGRAATTFGQGLLSGGLDLVSQGYNPYKTAFGTAQSVEQAGQGALDISSALAGRAATAGANVGNTLYTGGVAAANAAKPANAQNPYADLLAGAAGNPTITDFLNTWINKV